MERGRRESAEMGVDRAKRPVTMFPKPNMVGFGMKCKWLECLLRCYGENSMGFYMDFNG